jgi:hypothetical protein
MFHKKSNEVFSGQEKIGKARMLQSEESQAKPFSKFLGKAKMKKKEKHL